MTTKPVIAFIDSVHHCLEQDLNYHKFNCIDATDFTREHILEGLPTWTGIVIRSRTKIDKAFIDSATNLKFIARSGAGLENIDIEYAKHKGINIYNSPEGNMDAVGEQVIGMLLMLFNNLKRSDAEVRKGIWHREENRGLELKGKTVGILGYGNMGAALAKKLAGFGCRVIAYDKYKTNYSSDIVQEVDLFDFFNETEILSIHLPQNEETTYLVNEKYINKFRNNLYIINTARGKNIKTSALVNGLKNEKVLGACLDVLEYEKSSFENLSDQELPADFKYLTKAENVILSPHVAGWTKESYIKLSSFLAEKILKDKHLYL
jgi:D-3-phosphoglycerate dehydrogenase